MPTHLNPTSRMNSATATLSLSGFTQVVYWKRASIDSGELIVIVVAVRMASHGQRPRPLATASRSALMNISRIPAGAGVGSGRELGASMSDLSAIDSLIVSWEMMRLEKVSYEQREPARSKYRRLTTARKACLNGGMVSRWTGCSHRVRVCMPISPDPGMLQVFTIRAVRLEPAAVLPVSLQSSKHAAETSSAGCDSHALGGGKPA
jgi:hypothetical protein